MEKNSNPNGSRWQDLQKELYSKEEIEESKKRVVALGVRKEEQK